jgi:hypothetical protein
MGSKKIVGIILVIIGLGVALTGYELSGTPSNQLNEVLKGSPTQGVVVRYIAGAVCVAVGAFLAK